MSVRQQQERKARSSWRRVRDRGGARRCDRRASSVGLTAEGERLASSISVSGPGIHQSLLTSWLAPGSRSSGRIAAEQQRTARPPVIVLHHEERPRCRTCARAWTVLGLTHPPHRGRRREPGERPPNLVRRRPNDQTAELGGFQQPQHRARTRATLGGPGGAPSARNAGAGPPSTIWSSTPGTPRQGTFTPARPSALGFWREAAERNGPADDAGTAPEADSRPAPWAARQRRGAFPPAERWRAWRRQAAHSGAALLLILSGLELFAIPLSGDLMHGAIKLVHLHRPSPACSAWPDRGRWLVVSGARDLVQPDPQDLLRASPGGGARASFPSPPPNLGRPVHRGCCWRSSAGRSRSPWTPVPAGPGRDSGDGGPSSDAGRGGRCREGGWRPLAVPPPLLLRRRASWRSAVATRRPPAQAAQADAEPDVHSDRHLPSPVLPPARPPPRGSAVRLPSAAPSASARRVPQGQPRPTGAPRPASRLRAGRHAVPAGQARPPTGSPSASAVTVTVHSPRNATACRRARWFSNVNVDDDSWLSDDERVRL